MSLISCAQMVGKPRIASDPAAAPAIAAAPFNSVRRFSFFAGFAAVPAGSEVNVLLAPSDMATLVGYDERSHRSPLTGCLCDQLRAKLGAGFCEVKLEVKIRRINAANGSGRCIGFWQHRTRRRQDVYTRRRAWACRPV